MLRSKWLQSFELTSEEKWQLKWTAGGAQRRVRLKLIIDSYQLGKHELFPVGFTLLARDGKAPGQLPGVLRKELDFWRNCSNEISLASSLEECAMFVQIVSENYN